MGCLLKLFSVMLACGVMVFFFLDQDTTLVTTSVTQALLTQFNFNNTNNNNASTLAYELAFRIDLRNPNRWYRVYYDNIQIAASYKNQTFASMNWKSFGQARKNTTYLTPSFKGQISGILGGVDDAGASYYDIVIKLNLQNDYLRLYHWINMKTQTKTAHTCELKVPLVGDGQSAGAADSFNTIQCGCEYIF
ncbi:hypothetical protein M0R45_015764 [Rubus argutus]|uniref:Late embryogenesis abundant protein LEA-2 subgroup domain-containing protein n=1 Tax=Rubus argutus TaxID=59490 RepID=A0AAW1XSJ3_RUBAR